MIILASNSPRRAKLLADCGIEFKAIRSHINEEEIGPFDKPEDLVIALSNAKALNVAKNHYHDVVIGADTIVVHENVILGKPKDLDDAYQMLKRLSNERHFVYTGVTIVKEDTIDSFYEVSEVFFKQLSDLEIKEYIKTGEPMDKAGAYAIQGEGSKLVEKYNGDFFNIVGLPLKTLLEKLKSFNK